MNKKEEFIKNYIRNIAQQEILKDKIQQIKINSKLDEIKQAMKNCNKEPDDSKYFNYEIIFSILFFIAFLLLFFGILENLKILSLISLVIILFVYIKDRGLI